MTDLETIARVVAGTQPTDWLPNPSGASVSLLAHGTYHSAFLIFDGDARVVARTCRVSQWGLTVRNQLRREFDVLRDLQPSGATPTPFALAEGDPPVLFESFEDGRAYDYRSPAACARAIASFHRQPIREAIDLPVIADPASALAADGRRRIDGFQRSGSPPPVVTEMLSAVETLNSGGGEAGVSPATSIVHTDLIHTNILETNTGLRIIDWEGAQIGPVEWDLAYLMSPVTLRWSPVSTQAVDASWRHEFFSVYSHAMGLDEHVLRKRVAGLLPAVVFRALCWCVEASLTAGASAHMDPRVASFADLDYVRSTLRTVGDISSSEL